MNRCFKQEYQKWKILLPIGIKAAQLYLTCSFCAPLLIRLHKKQLQPLPSARTYTSLEAFREIKIRQNKPAWYLVASTALIFRQIRRILVSDGGSGFCFWHLVRGSRRKSVLNAQAALEWVIYTGKVERWQSCTAAEPQHPAQGWAPVSTELTGNTATEQEINWKSKPTIKPSSMLSGVGHH